MGVVWPPRLLALFTGLLLLLIGLEGRQALAAGHSGSTSNFFSKGLQRAGAAHGRKLHATAPTTRTGTCTISWPSSTAGGSCFSYACGSLKAQCTGSTPNLCSDNKCYQCCNNCHCPADRVCTNNACVCKQGFKTCGGTCIRSSQCCALDSKPCPGTSNLCIGGNCTCATGFSNCNNNAADGCEVNTLTDANNCGSCKRTCGANAACVGGQCQCRAGFASCDGISTNGCEANLNTSSTTCGACGVSCNATTQQCTNGRCTCKTGYKACGGTCIPSSQCCALDTKPCPGTNNLCISGNCTCATGFNNCNNNAADGCEVNTLTDANNCGSCKRTCGANAACVGGQCQCLSGFASCDGISTNGCEANLNTSSTTCGACGVSCDATTQQCTDGRCTCKPGYKACGGSCITDSSCCPWDATPCPGTKSKCISGTCTTLCSTTSCIAQSCKAGPARGWGWNVFGQVGDGTTTQRNSPVPVSGGAIFTQISAGVHFTCGIRTDGGAMCWGNNILGQLGDGSTMNRNTPVNVSGGYAFTQISGGEKHACGILSDSKTICWGANFYGGLGDGSTGGVVATPVYVSGSHKFTQISAGYDNTCGIRDDGRALCWGYNGWGALGDGTKDARLEPVEVVPGGATDDGTPGVTFTQISTGGLHTCALRSDGGVMCWGHNEYGQLGDGTVTQPQPSSESTTPLNVSVSGGATFTQISAGYEHTCGIRTDGGAVCWGRNDAGQLGDGTTTQRAAPVAVSGGATFTQISAGRFHTCGICTDGTAVCWGLNNIGRLGDGTTTNSNTPVAVSFDAPAARVTQIEAGEGHTTALTALPCMVVFAQ